MGKLMGFYDDAKNVDQYIEMCKGYDGSNIYQLLQRHLKGGESVLELGSGAGFDISFLAEHYQVTGSDFSEEFLARCKKKFPDVSFLKIDASNINLTGSFDCIYSNKVLHHLTEEKLQRSLLQQAKALKPEGIIAHSFWIGDEDLEMNGLLFKYYSEKAAVQNYF